MSERAKRGRGRPRGEGPGAREAILGAASTQFSELGYQATTLRGIAGQAGVDASLVSHYFGNKQRLFAEVVELPVDLGRVLPGVVQGPRDQIGHRVATLIVAALAQERPRQRALSLIRAASTNPDAAHILRRRLTGELLEPLAGAVSNDEPRLRAAMMMSQVVGLVMARHVVGLEPLRLADDHDLVTVLGPVFQHYLTGDLLPS